jgi:cell division initiation protein
MRITPLDVRNHPFRTRFSGYDREEVDAFLRMTAEDYEEVVREAELLREQVIKLEAKISDLAANESILQETLTSTAVQEAEVRVGEAAVKAEKTPGAAHRRAAKLAEDIRELKQLRTRLAASVRAAIETHMGLLEGLSAEDPDDPILEGKVSYLTRPAKEAKSGGEG